MANPNKAKGTAFESDVAKMLQSWGFDAWRMAQTGSEDQGDIGGLKDWAFEVRNRANSTWQRTSTMQTIEHAAKAVATASLS